MEAKIQFCFQLPCFTFFLLILIVHQSDCLSIKPRIIEGKPARIGQFPWQVMFYKSENREFYAGGSIISVDWVLTAAHVTYQRSSVHMKVGTNFLHSRRGVNLISKEIYNHPDYDDETLHNDIALVKLPTSLKITKTVRPIRLVPYFYQNANFVGESATISGFGFVDDDTFNPYEDLLYAEVTIISNDECRKSYDNKVFESTICSIGADDSKQSFCDGDSGGPLVYRDFTGEYFQIGIISFSALLSCSRNYPGAYSRITTYLDFIKDITDLPLD